MLIDVLTRVASDTGYHPIQQRDKLLQLLNDAAKDLLNILECTKVYREVTLVVPPDKVVALPHFIGEVRNLRALTPELPFNLHSIGQPRYTSNTWQHKVDNWRDLGDSPIHTHLSSIGPVYFSVGGIETTPAVIKVCGQTVTGNREEESVTIDSVVTNTTKSFGLEIYSITSASARTYDILVSSASAELAVLYNDQKRTRYKLIDVSEVFWSYDTTAGEALIDVLYKMPAIWLSRDTDSFYGGDDYDNAWYSMTMYYYNKVLQDRSQIAGNFYQEALGFMQQDKESMEQGQLKKLHFGRNKYYGIFRSPRYYPYAPHSHSCRVG